MSIRIKNLLTEWITGEKVTNTDLNDTFEYVGRNMKNVRDVTSPYTAAMDDDVLVLKPSASTNSYTAISLGGGYLYGDKNFCSANNDDIFFGLSTGSTRFARYKISTNTTTDLGAGNANGITAHATDGTYIFYTDYTANVKAFNISTAAITNFATCPANIYGLTRNPTTGDLYAVGYTGRVYKITPGGSVSTLSATDLHANGVDCIWCDASDNVYITNGAASWRITGGTPFALSNIIPSAPASYRSADNSLYYKRSINGYMYYCKYSLTSESESILTLAQYAGGTSAYCDGTSLFEGQSSNPNQFSKIALASYVPVLMLSLPAPSAGNKGKGFKVTAPYGYVNAPFIAGKMLVDTIPTNTNNIVNLMTLPYGGWSANTRSVDVVSDGTYWITTRS